MPELLICAAVFLLLFGGARLPGLMRNMGRSINEFKAGIRDDPMKTIDEDDQETDDANEVKETEDTAA